MCLNRADRMLLSSLILTNDWTSSSVPPFLIRTPTVVTTYLANIMPFSSLHIEISRPRKALRSNDGEKRPERYPNKRHDALSSDSKPWKSGSMPWNNGLKNALGHGSMSGKVA